MEDNKYEDYSYKTIPLEVGNIKNNFVTNLGSKIKRYIVIQKKLLLWKRPLFLFYVIFNLYIIFLLLFFTVKYFMPIPSLIPALFFNQNPQLISKYILPLLILIDILLFLISTFIYSKIYYRIKEIAYFTIVFNLIFSILLFLTFYKIIQMSL
ncbi:MAG: hypothetical protein ACYDBX_01290 [Patescibacteria group bacterium]